MRPLLGTVCLILLVVGCGKGTPSANPEKGPTAEELSEEFKRDAQAADKKYQGKTVTLSGEIVENMPKDATGKPHVIIILKGLQKDDNPANDGPSINCAIAESSAGKAAALVSGQSIKVTGKYKKVGKEEPAALAEIFLEECQIEGAPSDLAISVTAADLARAFATDEAAAKKKYSGNIVLLTGKFERTDHVQLLGNICVLEGHKIDENKMFGVVALIPDEQTYQHLSGMNPGDQVKLRARVDGRVTNNDGSKHVRLTGAKIVK
jgi:hypothetical protein